MKEETEKLSANFLTKYKSFNIDSLKNVTELKTSLDEYQIYLKKMIDYYNHFDKEYQQGKNSNDTYKQYRDRLFSLIQICQNLVVIPLNNKIQSIEANKSIKAGRQSVYLGLASIFLGLFSVWYSISTSKNTPTVETIDQNSLNIIDTIAKEINEQQSTIDSLLIEKKNGYENFEKINLKLNSIESSINKANNQIRIIKKRMTN